MPPRAKKTTQAKPESEAEQETLQAPADEVPDEQPAAADPEAATPEDVSEPTPPVEPEPARGDAQSDDLPCPVCFSDGWPDGVTSRGCEHGTWQRPAGD